MGGGGPEGGREGPGALGPLKERTARVIMGASEGGCRPPGLGPRRVTAVNTCTILPSTRGHTKCSVFMGKGQYYWGSPV